MKLQYGQFLDKFIADRKVENPREKNYFLVQKRKNEKSLAYEYFYRDKNGKLWIVKNPTKFQAMLAKMRTVSGIAGYRNKSKIVDTIDEIEIEK